MAGVASHAVRALAQGGMEVCGWVGTVLTEDMDLNMALPSRVSAIPRVAGTTKSGI
jgi:hypothetical protein